MCLLGEGILKLWLPSVCPSIPNPKPELESSWPNQGPNLETASTEARSKEPGLVVGAGRLGTGDVAMDAMPASP